MDDNQSFFPLKAAFFGTIGICALVVLIMFFVDGTTTPLLVALDADPSIYAKSSWQTLVDDTEGLVYLSPIGIFVLFYFGIEYIGY